MNPAPQAKARTTGRRFDPKYTPFLVPAIMAIAMSFVMSLVQTIARLGFAPNLASAWLTSFAIGAAVAIPTAILVAPSARRLAGHLTGTRATRRRATANKPVPESEVRQKETSDPTRAAPTRPEQPGANGTAGRPAQIASSPRLRRVTFVSDMGRSPTLRLPRCAVR